MVHVKKSTLKTIAAIAAIVCGITLFSITFIHAFWYAPEKEVPQNQLPSVVTVAETSTSTPTELIIPTLHIDAKIQHVGITFKGNMGVPTNYTDVGWYRYGTIPGHIGSSVIDGHVDDGFSLPGVFKHLKELQAGDDIYVVEGGQKLHFVVTDKQIYYYKNAPLDLIFNRKDKARLNLITCDGTWISEDQTDDHRVVVFTVLK